MSYALRHPGLDLTTVGKYVRMPPNHNPNLVLYVFDLTFNI